MSAQLKSHKLPLIAILFVFLILTVASVHTFLPWCDEAWFVSPALNLIEHGHTGVSVLDETAGFRENKLLRINQRMYWEPPLQMLSQVVWFKLISFNVFTLRYLSTLWGLLALVAWYFIMKILAQDHRVALLTAGLMAVDFTVIWTASEGRMDMMAASLGQLALAAYLLLREKNFGWAVFVSQTLIAGSGMSHPMGLGDFVGLLALTLYYDRKRIRVKHLAIAAIPYLVGAAGWALYILKDVEAFTAQFHGNAASRFALVESPLAILHHQVVERYLYMFGLAPDTLGFSHLKLYLLAVYAVGVLGFLFNRQIRAREGYRALLIVWAASFATYMLIDKEIHIFYLIHFIVLIIPMTAAWIIWCWDHRPFPRLALAGALALFFLIQLSVVGWRVKQDQYRNAFLATTDYLKQNAVGKGIIFGSAELAFELGFDGPVVDDYRLGYLSGKKAAYIVIDRNRYEEWIPLLATQEPPAHRYITDLLKQNFHKVLDVKAYQIYARNDL